MSQQLIFKLWLITSIPFKGWGIIAKITFDNRFGSETNPITPAQLRTARFCRQAFNLAYVIDVDESSIPIRGESAKSLYIANRIDKLFTKEHGLAYNSAEAFGNAASGLWKMNYGRGGAVFHERPVLWEYPAEPWVLAAQIRRACFNYYRILEMEDYLGRVEREKESPIVFQNQARISFYKNLEFKFRFEDRFYLVDLEEVWKGMVVKTNGLWKRRPTEKELDSSLDMTLKALCFSRMAAESEAFRIMCEVESGQAEMLGERNYMIGGLSLVYNDLVDAQRDKEETKERGGKKKAKKKGVIDELSAEGLVLSTARDDSALSGLREAVALAEEMIAGSNYVPNLNGCYVCRFNVEYPDGSRVCEKAKPKKKAGKEKEGQQD